MPSELEIMPDGQARMFYYGPTPWHGLGKSVLEAPTSERAIQLAGLGRWGVGLERFASETSIFEFIAAGKGIKDLAELNWSEDWRAITRSTLDDRILGVATESYQPIQNEVMFAFLDSLVADRVLHYETAGSLMGGRRVWILARIEEDMQIGSDTYHRYILLVAGHDNYSSLRIYFTDVRVVCNNTLTQATRRTPATIRIVHSGDIGKKMVAARDLLAIETDARSKMEEWLNRLAYKKIGVAESEQIRDALFEPLDDATPKRRRDAIDKFMAIYSAECAREGRTAYALVQTITGYGDHMITYRKRDDGEERMRSALGGTGQKFKQKGISLVASIVNIPAPVGLLASAAT